MLKVLHLPRESLGQASEAPHAHMHREVLTLNVAGGNCLRVRIPDDGRFLGARALRGDVADFARNPTFVPVELHKHRVVNRRAESPLDGLQIGLVAVCGQRYAIRKASRDIFHELERVAGIAATDKPRHDELRVSVECRLGPSVTSLTGVFHVLWAVLVFGVCEGPDFVALNFGASQIAKRLVLVVAASLPEIPRRVSRPCLWQLRSCGRLRGCCFLLRGRLRSEPAWRYSTCSCLQCMRERSSCQGDT